METSPIKDILYHQISRMPESRILKELSSGSKKGIIAEILRKCMPEITKLEGDSYENVGVFAESLSHYLLTNAMIPSQRKVTTKNTQVDVVIPDLRTLGTAPENSLVLYFAKTSDENSILESLVKLQNIQPRKEGIWVISKTRLKIPYKVFDVDGESSFASLLDDIEGFLSSKPQSKFRIFKT